jgi:glycogen debranching enzyme
MAATKKTSTSPSSGEQAGSAASQAERQRATGTQQPAGRRATHGSERVLRNERPSVRARFVQPVVLKQAALFLLCLQDGDVLDDSDEGLYFHDMRHLSAQTLRLAGQPPVSLLADASKGWYGLFELTNPDLHADGSLAVRKETIGIRREKKLGNDYGERLTITNFGDARAAFTLSLAYAADFADMFAVRGTKPGKRGALQPPSWRSGRLRFEYDGADGHTRSSTLHFNPQPDGHDRTRADFDLDLDPQQSWQLDVSVRVQDRPPGEPAHRPHAREGSRTKDQRHAELGGMGPGTKVTTNNELLNAVLTRSFLDLHMLRMRQAEDEFFAAGVPWYVALFGRDSIVTGLQVAAFEPEISAETLRVLARHQGTRVDDWRDEQPGKILHELRVDEMANLGEIPQTPYYGSVDSTPLFLALMRSHAAWVGTLDLFHELHDSVQGALDWIDRYGDSDGDGFVDYKTRSPVGGRNQGWKDSANGIVMEDGSLAEPPIALPEVQGDVYLAMLSAADLFARDGDDDRADALRARANKLRDAFNRDFWLADEGYYSLCRQADGRFSRSIASNAAHLLWTGIAEADRAEAVVKRAMQPDMFCGWGVRTLSSDDASYNPIDYQVGSVWPHDNAFIVEGMCRYGFHEQAERVIEGMLAAASRFRDYRLPEVFAGFDRSYAANPVQYPVACNPQAWASGSIPAMLTSVLGLQPDAFAQRLRIRRPHLPSSLHWVELRDLRIGDAHVSLRYERSGTTTLVAVTKRRGNLDVTIEP